MEQRRVKFRDTLPLHGTVKNVTVSLDTLGWHVALACEIEHQTPINLGPAAGRDRGVANTLALSTGEMLAMSTRLEALDQGPPQPHRPWPISRLAGPHPWEQYEITI